MSTKPQVEETVVVTPSVGSVPAADDFDAAWAESAAVTPSTAVAKEPAGTIAAAVEDADPTLAGDVQNTVASDKSSSVAATETSTAAAPAIGAAAAVDESPEVKIARLEAENIALRTPKPAPAAEPALAPTAAKPEPEAPVAPATPEWYKLTDDETTILNQHAEQWPDISRAEAVRTKQAVYNAVQYVFSKMHETYAPVLQRFSEMSDAISEQLTLGALRSEHEDYDEIYGEVTAWVPTLPAAFRQGAERVMREGTPEEVAELITAFKVQKPASAAAPVVPVAPRKTELSAPAKKAAQALTVITSKRTTPVAPADANDYDGAWAEANRA